MRVFYALMLAVTRFELAIARTYSDNRAYIHALSSDVAKWEKELLRWEMNYSPRL